MATESAYMHAFEKPSLNVACGVKCRTPAGGDFVANFKRYALHSSAIILTRFRCALTGGLGPAGVAQRASRNHVGSSICTYAQETLRMQWFSFMQGFERPMRSWPACCCLRMSCMHAYRC